ncbi:band 4.1-like protein 3 [Puntigrus tetrazona]|uniref:band 4.1-like protein 3 n=1 Tax=Puntigrus tetrazona TaxID=1606681 RepID=UPI001C8A5214|nr:band 4.1-like protein 3 [Puntigrus tetrazona]
MTTEPESQSEQQGASAAPPHSAPPLDNQLPPAAAHSTPVRKEQGGGFPQGRADHQSEDDGASHWSSSSKLTRSPVKISRKPKNMQCKVTLLDGSDYTCVVEKRDKGQVLFDKVCEHLNLLERDYFGVTFRDVENQKNWLDPAKDMKKQIRGVAWNFSFNVKFYPPEPALLSEDITRYLLCLQLRKDILIGRLSCPSDILALLGSYTVQSTLGDYDPNLHQNNYVSEIVLAPNQSEELEKRIMELHSTYRFMSPAQADMLFLENAMGLPMYGEDLHPAKDVNGADVLLGVCSEGLMVYEDEIKTNIFLWPRVLKISHKRSTFLLKMRPSEEDEIEGTISFSLTSYRACKQLWKCCVEHHSFFRNRLQDAKTKRLLTLGSRFRYHGRTQSECLEASNNITRAPPRFTHFINERKGIYPSI